MMITWKRINDSIKGVYNLNVNYDEQCNPSNHFLCIGLSALSLL